MHFIRTKILHFAAEPVIERILRSKFSNGYQTAEIEGKSDLQLDIECINLASNSVSTVICLHVLEHVDDVKALSELFRILTDDSFLILAFPIIEGWELTYENSEIGNDLERVIHFGQADHVRYYGSDVRTRIENQGFQIIQEAKG